MKIILIILFFLVGQNLSAQTVFLNKDKLSCTLPNQNDRQTGIYQSFYANGQKKAEGKLQNGLRIGTWSVWDSTGNKLIERSYENPWCFKQKYPAVKSNETIKLFASQSCERVRDSLGLITYAPLKESSVSWSKRLWNEVSETNNPEFFNVLWQTIDSAITKDSMKIYSEDWKPVEFRFDPKSMKVVGFELKEDLFFDTERMISEIRTLAIKPLIVSKITGENLESFNIYFPHLRKHLAKVAIEIPTNKEIKNLDDIFLYRNFAASIIKESNWTDREMKEYIAKEDLPAEQQRIICESLEAEHDWWIAFSPR